MKIDNKLILENSKDLIVLYVEDDESLRSSTASIFSNFFKQVDIASDGQEGFDTYMKYKKDTDSFYDLVISDINMPNMNGLEMSELINKEHFEQAIIFITAHDEAAYLHDAIKLGANGFLTKPLDSDQLKVLLYKTTQSIVDRKEAENYYKKLEELNIELSKTIDELHKKSSEVAKSTRILNTIIKKEQVLNIKKKDKSKSITEDENYSEQLEEFRRDDLYELREIHDEIDVSIINILQANNLDSIDKNILNNIVDGFTKYASVIAVYPFFNDLSKAINGLVETMKTNDLPEDKQSAMNIFILLETFMYVLGRWTDDLSSNDVTSVNKLDASIINDLHTIRTMWLNEFDEFDEAEEIEFF